MRFLVPRHRPAGRLRPARAAKLLPVLTMVLGYSRFSSAVLVPSRSAEDLYAGWWRLIAATGGGAAGAGVGR